MKTTTVKRFAAIAMTAVALAGCNSWKDIERPDDSDIRYVMPQNVAPEDNAYESFVAALNAVVDWSACDYRKLKANEVTDESVFTNESAFALFHEAARKPYWIAPRKQGCLPCVPMYDWSRFYNLLDNRIARLIERDDMDETIDCIEDILSLSRTASLGNGALIGYLVGVSTSSSCCLVNAERLVGCGKASDEQLRRLIGLFETFPSARVAIPMAFRSEYEFFNFVEECVKPEDMRTWWGKPLYLPNKVRQTYLDLLRGALELAVNDYDDKAWREFDKNAELEIPMPDLELEGVAPNELWHRLVGGWRETSEVAAKSDWQCAAARIVVANELFRRRNGRYADSLEELVPEYLKEVPVDPFGKGAPINYDAKRGVIYSVGPEGDVNGEVTDKTRNKTLALIRHLDGTEVERPKKDEQLAEELEQFKDCMIEDFCLEDPPEEPGPSLEGSESVAPDEQEDKTVEIHVRDNGVLRLNRKTVTLETLKEGLKALPESRRKESVVIKAWPNSLHEELMSVIDACIECGFNRLALFTI